MFEGWNAGEKRSTVDSSRLKVEEHRQREKRKRQIALDLRARRGWDGTTIFYYIIGLVEVK
jgi:hypothetical protein